MIAFIKKDVLSLKKEIWIYFGMFIFMSLLLGNDISKMFFICFFYATMLFFTSFGHDEKANFMGYGISMPYGRIRLVSSKYGSSLLIVSTTILLSTFMYLAGSIMGNSMIEYAFLEILPYLIMSLSIVIAIMIPFIYLFGLQKARIILFTGFMLIPFAINGLSKSMSFSIDPIFLFIENHLIGMILITILIVLISFYLSLQIVKRKDF